MSRTYKDKPFKTHPSHWKNDLDWDKQWVDVLYRSPYGDEVTYYQSYRLLPLPTTKPKKRKAVNTEHHWMTTPGWWVRMMMNKPQRREHKLWERKVLITDLDDVVEPGKKYKHVYFW